MAQVIGVRFKDVGKIYYFDPLDLEIIKGSRVIVETARGVECGEVATERKEVSDKIPHFSTFNKNYERRFKKSRRKS